MQVEPVRSFRSGRSYLTETCSPQVVIVCLLSACFSLMLGFWADDEPELRRFFEVCKGTGRKRTCYSRPWTALFVGNVLLAATAMMMQGYRSHFVFMGAVTLFGTCGVISTSQALAGFSSPGNIAFQAVLVLVGGIQDSGVLDHIFSRLLGAEQKNLKAFLRVQLVTAFLSAFVQQTTVVVAAAPALQRWAPQAGFTPREILLPIASVGGMSQNFMIVTSTVALTIFQTMPEAELQMLDPALGCIVLTALTCMLLGPEVISLFDRASKSAAADSLEFAAIVVDLKERQLQVLHPCHEATSGICGSGASQPNGALAASVQQPLLPVF